MSFGMPICCQRTVAVNYVTVNYVTKRIPVAFSSKEYLWHFRPNPRYCHVTFMDRSKKDAKSFKWPTKPDTLWVCFEDILCLVKDPVPTGRFGRTFELDEEDAGLIVDLFNTILTGSVDLTD